MYGPSDADVKLWYRMFGVVAIVVLVIVFFLGRCSRDIHVRVWTQPKAEQVGGAK